ncbi:hypothetical protein P152DRAFT_271285 [Eremomyces bilateralis CBS 781.70]|uniref:Uncharacterized protein n=1 Tax=Eremomyces bilateralis CBS 781.70 TaxID=1392243 RepID=A0A6G1G953_9PEZI|nr:uncharacterized protein P152DRAFT_271285 [Eremomyces bilateralis CBS 781.70]KAF1814431.1 hypothetical protein P152DRAFT_271285 [Eremomyces bilateralis CBS 781.70]
MFLSLLLVRCSIMQMSIMIYKILDSTHPSCWSNSIPLDYRSPILLVIFIVALPLSAHRSLFLYCSPPRTGCVRYRPSVNCI